MDDKTLLERAARAYWAGELGDVVSFEWSDADNCILYTHAQNQDHNGQDRTFTWNPLDSNHDAFMLMTRLQTCINFASGWTACYAGSVMQQQFSERHFDNPYEATRRAIVRAAAAIGSAHESQ